MLFKSFLPRDAMLARTSYGPVNVCDYDTRHAGILLKRLDESSCFFGVKASFHLSYTAFQGNSGIPKIRVGLLAS